MEGQKRERSANFNSAEVELVLSLVDKYRTIIENKKTDAVTNKDKENAWKKIENIFNSCGITTSVRTWKTLKLKYEAIKKGTKKKSSQHRQEMYRTGGGPSNAPDFNKVDEKVLSICSNIKGLEARYDSDTISKEPYPVEDILLEPFEVCPVEDTPRVLVTKNITQTDDILYTMDESFTTDIVGDNDTQKENKWEKWNPKALKARVSNALKSDVTNKASVTAKLDKLSQARLELVQLQMETARKQLQFMEDEHKIQMKHLENDEKRKEEVHIILLQKNEVCTEPWWGLGLIMMYRFIFY